MDWIALRPSREDEAPAWGWQALRFTPRVARVEEAVLLEVSASLRLFGGGEALVRALLADGEGLSPVHWARAATSLVALALARLQAAGQLPPARLPDDLPLALLPAAAQHQDLLARAGLVTWGQLHALPRGPLARRFGPTLLDALDAAWGRRPERYPWLQWPEAFDQGVELPAAVADAPGLMDAAQHLLSLLQLWLRARQRGVLAFELEWTLDLRRLDGVELPPREQQVVRTAQAMQAGDHLRRLVGEQLARVRLAAPARHLRLRSLETVPWPGGSRGFLPEEAVEGERLHELVERLSARLGEAAVQVPVPRQDWRPERRQGWEPALHHLDTLARRAPSVPPVPVLADSLLPPWLLPEPLRLEVRGERPWYQGPLRLLTRRQRVETGWWEGGPGGGGTVVRDYCIARSERAGLLWVFCERGSRAGVDPGADATPRWFLQGLYA